MTPKEICAEAAMKLNLPHEYVWEVYKSFWKTVRIYIATLPLKEDIAEEDLSKIKTSVNIPSIGKFYLDWDKLKRKKDKYERYSNKKA